MEFWQGLEYPRNDIIYSSGNRGVKKGQEPRGTRDEEFLVPSLVGLAWHLVNGMVLIFFEETDSFGMFFNPFLAYPV